MTKELNLTAFITRHDKSPDLYFLEADHSEKKFTITKQHPLVFEFEFYNRHLDRNYKLEKVYNGYILTGHGETERNKHLFHYENAYIALHGGLKKVYEWECYDGYGDDLPQGFSTLEEALRFMAQFIDDWQEEGELVQDYFNNLTINL